jgi:hypothetical protein
MRTFLILCISLFSIKALAESTPKVVGEIGLIEGMVIVDSKRVGNGAKVAEGSVIEVKEDSKATLILGRGTVFHLAAGSKIVVNEYGITSETEERASLDLKFGRTRALILNQGGKRQINIRSRAVTMGVRGTEIFIDAPKETTRPLRYFTLEGSAELRLAESAPPIPLNQNQGLSTRGETERLDRDQGTPQTQPVKPAEVRNAIRESGMVAPPPRVGAIPGSNSLPPAANRGLVGQLSDQYGAGALAPVLLDPTIDRDPRFDISVKFCNASSGNCN